MDKLPEKWKIKPTEENHQDLANWRTAGHFLIEDKNCWLISDYKTDKGYYIQENEVEYKDLQIKDWVEITYDDFKRLVLGIEPAYVFPEKWCIKLSSRKINDAVNSINLWNNGRLEWFNNDSYFNHYITSDGEYTLNPSSTYQKIAFKEFKKYVLHNTESESKTESESESKETPMEKLIGYNLKDKKYLPALKAIAPNFDEKLHSTKGFELLANSGAYRKFNEAGLIDIWFEAVYVQDAPPFKVGDWVYSLKQYDGFRNVGDIFKVKSLTYSGIYYLENTNGSNSEFRLATKEEIKNYLVSEAIKKGFKQGVRFNCIKSTEPYCELRSEDWQYFEADDALSSLYSQYIYYNGKWAEIIPSIPDITIKGYKAKFKEDSVTFGCQEFSKEFITKLNNVLTDNNINMDYKKEISVMADYFRYTK